MRTHSTCARVLAIAILVAVAGFSPSEAQWLERYEISGSGGLPSLDRLLEVEIMAVNNSELISCDASHPLCPEAGFLLPVHGWEERHGHPEQPPLPICSDVTGGGTGPPDPEILYQQATPGARCSAVLVADDLVLSAGHCSPEGSCTHVSFLFGYSMADANDTTGTSTQDQDPLNDFAFFPASHVVPCQSIVVQGGTGTDDAAEMDQALLNPGGSTAVPSTDFAVMQMAADAPTGYLPRPIDRINATEAGDAAFCMSHPARLPMKAEEESIDEVNPADATLQVACYGLGGSSGGAVINLDTGMLAGVIRGVAAPVEAGDNNPPGCMNPCFTCPHDVTAVRASQVNLWIPPLGLQLTPATTVLEYYGPAQASPSDYPESSMTVSAPLGSLAVDWNVFGPTWFLPAIGQLTGPESGTLNPGDDETLTFAVTSNWIQNPGVTEYPTQYFDNTYETAAPVLHRIHTGVNGFTASPSGGFAGEGPGALPGDRTQYGIYNRWIVDQDITVSADQSWISVYEEYPPYGPTIRPLFTNFYTIEPDASGLSTGIHIGNVTWESQDSGTPSFAISREVRFDVGRFITAMPGTEVLTLTAANPVEEVELLWSGPTTPIADADIALAATVEELEKGLTASAKASIVSPDGTEVILDSVVPRSGVDTIYDDDTNPPEPGDPSLLEDLDGENPGGDPWLLRFERIAVDSEVTITRFEVRLHVD